MKVWVFGLCYNEAEILPWWLKHYEQFAEKILVWDDKSTDGSREILQSHPKVECHTWPYDDGISEDQFLDFANRTYPIACGKADWVMWVDMDELLYADDVPRLLEEERAKGVQVIPSVGFNMTGDGLPPLDNRQLWQIMQQGVHAPVYSKPVVFDPNCLMRWNRGKHALAICDGKIADRPKFKLLHYRYLGVCYTKGRNAKNYARCGLSTGDKGAAWSCAPGYTGEHSAQWAEEAKTKSFNVITTPI